MLPKIEHTLSLEPPKTYFGDALSSFFSREVRPDILLAVPGLLLALVLLLALAPRWHGLPFAMDTHSF